MFSIKLNGLRRFINQYPSSIFTKQSHLNKYQELFKYILIDEYQDTNKVQDTIIRQLGAKYQNICIVGDDSQSIYSFRGANINNIFNFKSNYQNVKEFKLEQKLQVY